jgi:hypothetical protein
MKPIIYIRASLAEQEEIKAAKKYFEVVEQRTHIKKDSLVIPRYSALPYFKELEEDIKFLGSKTINTYRQHIFVADIGNWYYDLESITPKTWFFLDQVPENEGPYILKGTTNSKKHQWNTHMFAENKKAATEVYMRLYSDSFFLNSTQDIVFRKFVPLNKLADGLNGLPVSEEYRFFVLNGKIVDSGFYWSESWDEIKSKHEISPSNVPREFVNQIIENVSPRINFFVFDVARTQDGKWILVELNDGQMSGLSMIDPDRFYYNMSNILK